MTMTEKKTAVKKIQFKDTNLTRRLTSMGYVWEDAKPSDEVTVIAVEGAVGDWAAYIETPYTGSSPIAIQSSGLKLGAKAAAIIFPEWTDLVYRE